MQRIVPSPTKTLTALEVSSPPPLIIWTLAPKFVLYFQPTILW